MRITHLFVSLSLLLGAGPCVPVKAQEAKMPAEAGIHGGRIVQSGDRMFELVFTPEQLRVYPFDAQGSPLSSKGMEGFFTANLDGQAVKVPLGFVPGERAPSAIGERRDYLEALFDFRRLRRSQSMDIVITSGARHDRFDLAFTGLTPAHELVAGRTDELDPATTNPFALPLAPGELPVSQPTDGPLIHHR